ncbi:MAG: hypothetical protein JXB29_03735, partial [Sedimentisphaerales bacterium]|nr:hypothetical protein [Sedimentisphaerales bacterium]
MTIQFYCPNCGALIAFDRKHIGEQAHCTTCDQHFIIPSKDFEKPRKVKLQPEKPEPIIGFYRSALLDSWKLFFDRENTTSLVFVAAVVSFRFFLVEFCCLGSLIHFVLWGWLFGFY